MDTWLDLNTVKLLDRVDSRLDKDHLIRQVVCDYGLGKIVKYHQVHEGFEDYNVKLITSTGVYLVKFFSQSKSFRHVKDNVEGLVEFEKAGIRVPRLYRSLKGDYLYYYENDGVMALGTVMEFFDGRSF